MNLNTNSNEENRNQNQIKIGHSEIVQRASQLWEQAGHPVGRDTEIWLQAEAELLADGQRLGSPGADARKGTQSAKRLNRAPQPFQNMLPAQKAAPRRVQP